MSKMPKKTGLLHLESGRVSGTRSWPVPACTFARQGLAACKNLEAGGGVDRSEATKDRRADLTCRECRKIRDESSTCYACGTEFSLRDDGTAREADACVLTLVPSIAFALEKPIQVYVCGVARTAYSGMGHARDPKMACARAALERASICPGCGRGSGDGRSKTLPGSLCPDCYDLLEKARNLERTTEAVSWWTIPTEGTFPGLFAERDEEGISLSTVAVRLLATCAAGLGRRVELGGNRAKTLFREKFRSSDGGPSVELTEEQADAMRKLGKAIRACVEGAYLRGKREGRSVLLGLAAGELTVGELNDRSIRDDQSDELVE